MLQETNCLLYDGKNYTLIFQIFGLRNILYYSTLRKNKNSPLAAEIKFQNYGEPIKVVKSTETFCSHTGRINRGPTPLDYRHQKWVCKMALLWNHGFCIGNQGVKESPLNFLVCSIWGGGGVRGYQQVQPEDDNIEDVDGPQPESSTSQQGPPTNNQILWN